MTELKREALLEEAVELLKELGVCPACGGRGSYCRNCRGHGHDGCSCDKAGSWSPRDCTSCVRGQRYIKRVRSFLNKMRRVND